MPCNNNRAKAEGTEDIVNADEATRSHEAAASCRVVEKVNLGSDVLGSMIVIEEDEVEGWAFIVFKVTNGVNVENRYTV